MAGLVAAHPVVILKLPTKVKSIIAYAQSIASAIANNPSFPSPNPPLATLLSDIAALNAAESAVLSRTKGAVEIRNAKLAIVRNDLSNLKAYVQSVASAGAAENAPQVIASAAMAVRKTTLHDKAALEAKQGSVSGTVNLVAKAAARSAAYEWQYSIDQKGVDDASVDAASEDGSTSGLVPHGRNDVLLPSAAGGPQRSRKLEPAGLSARRSSRQVSARRARRGTPRGVCDASDVSPHSRSVSVYPWCGGWRRLSGAGFREPEQGRLEVEHVPDFNQGVASCHLGCPWLEPELLWLEAETLRFERKLLWRETETLWFKLGCLCLEPEPLRLAENGAGCGSSSSNALASRRAAVI